MINGTITFFALNTDASKEKKIVFSEWFICVVALLISGSLSFFGISLYNYHLTKASFMAWTEKHQSKISSQSGELAKLRHYAQLFGNEVSGLKSKHGALHQFEKQIREIVVPENMDQQFQFMGAGGSVSKGTQTEYQVMRKAATRASPSRFMDKTPPDLPKQTSSQDQMSEDALLSSQMRGKNAPMPPMVADKALPLLSRKTLPQEKSLIKSQMAKKDTRLKTSAVPVGKKQLRRSGSRKIVAQKNIVAPRLVRANRKHKAPKHETEPSSAVVSGFQKPLETIKAGEASILEIIKSTGQSVRNVME